MTEGELKMVREWIIWHIMREPRIIHNHEVRDIAVYGDTGEMTCVDLVDVIASLYELLHYQVTGEPYDYMWHWTNKVGGWVNDKLFMEMLREAVEGKGNE